jgi:hypothetical protein
VESNVAPGTGAPHGFSFEVPADATGPVTPQPIVDAGRFSYEAVAWHDGVLYETEDRGDAAFYRFLPARPPREWGDLATFGGRLQALAVRGRPNFDANTAVQGERYVVDWVGIDEPNPLTDKRGPDPRLRVHGARRPAEPGQPRDRAHHGTRLPAGGRRRRAVRPRRHPPRRDL